MKTSISILAFIALAALSANAQRRSNPTASATTTTDSTAPTTFRRAINVPAFRSIDTTKTAMKMRVKKDENGKEHKQEFRRKASETATTSGAQSRRRGGHGRPPVFAGNWYGQCNHFGNMGAGMLDAMTQFANSTMLGAEQIYDMATLIPDEPNRLLFVQNAFHNCYDTYQYEALMPLFSMPVYIRQFDDFLYDNLYEPYGNTNGYNWNSTASGYNSGYNNGYGNGYGNGYNNGAGNNGGYYGGNTPPPPPAPVYYYMSDADFGAALQAIGRSPFDESRLQTAKQITNANTLTTDQIRQVCRVFTYDDNKLEYAKYAYTRCYDPQNYFKVGDVFTFDGNSRNLSAFVMSNPLPPTPNYANQGSYGGGTYNGGGGNGGNSGYNGGSGNGGYNSGGGGGRGGNGGNYNGGGSFGNGGGAPVASPAPAPAPAPAATSDDDVQQIEQSLRAVRVESYKLEQAKAIANSRYFTAAQIRRLCRLINVESYKLDLAKHFYSRCVDKQNYFIINDIFSVQSYGRDLTEFAARGGR